jgi:hypothetical protein
MLKVIQNIIKPKRPTVASCVAAQAVSDAKLAVLLPKELQVLTLEQWQAFIKETVKPKELVNQPQSVAYTLEDGSVVVVDGVVPPLALIGGSVALGYVVLADRLGTRRQVAVTKPSIPQDS